MGKPLPLYYRLPKGLREQPGWVFIGTLIGMSGLMYVAGLTESRVAIVIGKVGVQVWGGFMATSGIALVAAILLGKHALQKLALRFMSITLLMYAGYVLTIASIRVSMMTVILIVTLSGLAELEVARLKALIRSADVLAKRLGEENDN